MAITDIIAGSGGSFQDAFYKSSANRRAEESHGLRQMMGQQTVQENQMKLQAQQKQAAIMTKRQEAISEYSGDKKGLVDALFNEGDLEGAANIVQFEQGMQNLSKSQQEEAQNNLDMMSNASLESSGVVMEAFARNPQEGMKASMQEADRLAQQFPQMREHMPDLKSMNPEQAKTWWANKYNRSSKNREFEEKKRHQKEAERTAAIKAAKVSYGSSEFERLEASMQAGTATPSERQRHDVLSGKIGRAPTKGTEERFEKRLNFDIKKQKVIAAKDKMKAATTYRKEAAKDVGDLKSMDRAAEMGLKNIEIGGSLGSKNVKIALSQIAGSKVRALAQLQEFKNYGNLAQRAIGMVTDWVSGGYSAEQLDMAKQIFTELRDTVTGPGIQKSDDFYRSLAKDGGLDPHNVVPFESRNGVRDAMEAGILTYDQARRIIGDNPNWSKQ